MTDNTIPQSVSKNQVYKQAGLFAEDGEVILLTGKEKKAIYKKAYKELNHDRLKTQDKVYRESNKDKIKANKKAYHIANPEKKKAIDKAYREVNKEKLSVSSKVWRAINNEKQKVYFKAYHKTNHDKHIAQAKIYYSANKEKVNANRKALHIANPKKKKAMDKVYLSKNAKYETYKDKLKIYENISQNVNGILLVECAYCGKNYNPTNTQVNRRIQAINGSISGEQRFYCSKLCKIACPTYGQKTRYKFQHIGYTREVPAEFRQIALLDRNYTCEKCGSDENGLHVHHIAGQTESPMEMADLPNVKVLCASCHKAAHSVPGCFYVDYSCKHQKQ